MFKYIFNRVFLTNLTLVDFLSIIIQDNIRYTKHVIKSDREKIYNYYKHIYFYIVIFI